AQLFLIFILMSSMMQVPDYVHRSNHYLVGLQARFGQQCLRDKLKLLSHYEQLSSRWRRSSRNRVAFSIGSIAKITPWSSFRVSKTKCKPTSNLSSLHTVYFALRSLRYVHSWPDETLTLSQCIDHPHHDHRSNGFVVSTEST